MSLSSSLTIYPKLSRKDSFFPCPSFSSVTLHTAWKMRLSSPMNFDPKFPQKYRFLEGGKRVIYRTINRKSQMITTPPFYSWKCDWKFRLDIIVQCLWLTQEWSTEDDMSSMNAHRQNLLSLRLSFRQYSRHTTYFKWYWVCCYTNTSPRQIHLCLTWACSEPSIFCFCSVR